MQRLKKEKAVSCNVNNTNKLFSCRPGFCFCFFQFHKLKAKQFGKPFTVPAIQKPRHLPLLIVVGGLNENSGRGRGTYNDSGRRFRGPWVAGCRQWLVVVGSGSLGMLAG